MSREAPPSDGMTKMWLCRPSFHSSQRRNGIDVMMRDFTGLSLSAFAALSLQAMSAQPANADAVKTIVAPSGDSTYESTPMGTALSCFASPPADDSRKI